MSFKDQYNVGLKLIKDDLEECRNHELYCQIVGYTEYPLSLMEMEVKEAILNRIDTESFYAEKCSQIDELYKRLLATIYIVDKNFNTLSARIKRGIQTACNNVMSLIKKD